MVQINIFVILHKKSEIFFFNSGMSMEWLSTRKLSKIVKKFSSNNRSGENEFIAHSSSK